VAYGIIAMVAFFVIQEVFSKAFGQSKSTSSGSTSSVFSVSKKSTSVRDHILICGPSGSGKTTLFNMLLTGEFRNSVSSIKVNQTPEAMELVAKTKTARDGGEDEIKKHV
jgi:ABC-type lipoprotein export system ATPase subunit